MTTECECNCDCYEDAVCTYISGILRCTAANGELLIPIRECVSLFYCSNGMRLHLINSVIICISLAETVDEIKRSQHAIKQFVDEWIVRKGDPPTADLLCLEN